jgi:hypothetical protein
MYCIKQLNRGALMFGRLMLCLVDLYTVKKVIVFPVPSQDVTNQTLAGRE